MYKVMIVDDRDIIRRELKRLKIWGETSGFIIELEAGNGEEAIAQLTNHPVDLVITDIKMPKIDGIELLREIVEGGLCSLVVLLSDYSEFEFARQGIILGAFDYLSKPVNEAELDKLLKRAKEQLDNEKKEKEHLKQLEGLSYELTMQNNQIMKMENLMELIKSGNSNTLNYIEQMIDRMKDNYLSNVNAYQNVLYHTLQELTNEITKSIKWFDKFFDTTKLQNFNYFSGRDFDEAKQLFLDPVKELMSLFRLLRYDILEKGIAGQICNYVLNHVDEEISLAVVADSLFMNKTYISELFKQKAGTSFSEYVTTVKMERARMLILSDNRKTFEIAELLGFKDTEYFSKVFKKCTGMAPTEFRKKYGKEQ